MDKFEQEWGMKPVTLRGYMDHHKEIMVIKSKDGEAGAEVITPFYTHLDKNEQPCGVMVNRGWMPKDLLHMKMDRATDSSVITGVLYRGDAETKYSKPNTPVLNQYKSVIPEQLAVVNQLPNAEAEQVMVHAIDFDEDARTIHPTVPTKGDLGRFQISPERHNAYAKMW